MLDLHTPEHVSWKPSSGVLSSVPDPDKIRSDPLLLGFPDLRIREKISTNPNLAYSSEYYVNTLKIISLVISLMYVYFFLLVTSSIYLPS